MACGRFLVSVVAVGSLITGSATASAGPFGGFSRDRSRYLVGSDRVCEPIRTGGRAGQPRCTRAAPDQIARLGFDKGHVQRGVAAEVAARAVGTSIRIVAKNGKTVLTEWDAGSPVGAISAVYLSADRSLVAVEYAARRGGRAVSRAVVLSLRKSSAGPGTPRVPRRPAGRSTSSGKVWGTTAPGRGSGASPGRGAAQPPQPTTTTQAADTSHPKLMAALRAADRLLARKKWKLAATAYRRALGMSDHPAARFGLAAALSRLGRHSQAVSELAALARSTHPDGPYWLVEARDSDHFARMRASAEFRRTVGIDRDPNRPRSAYERLVGLGGRWEQAALPCQRPTVDLRLSKKPPTSSRKTSTERPAGGAPKGSPTSSRKTRGAPAGSPKFALTIRTRCQGVDETTRLGGTWRASGKSTLTLYFPNPDGPDEKLDCTIAAAADRSAEDVVTCSLEELSFDLRVVRR